jgi:hypothetical protein
MAARYPQRHQCDEQGGVLAHRTYGRDLETSMQQIGFYVGYLKEQIKDQGILNTELYCCRKISSARNAPSP